MAGFAGHGAVMSGCQVRRISEEKGVAGFAGPGLTRQDRGEGAGFAGGFVAGWASREPFEGGLDGAEIVEGVEAVGAAAEFARGLRAAEQEEAQNCGLVATEVEDGTDSVLVLGDPCVANRSDEGEIFKGVEGLPDLLFGEIEDRVAAGALVACVDQGIQRERVIFGRGDLFFNQGAKDAELDRVEMHVYKGATGEEDDNGDTYVDGKTIIFQ